MYRSLHFNVAKFLHYSTAGRKALQDPAFEADHGTAQGYVALYPADCGFGLMFGRHEILPIVRCTVSVEINMPVLHGHVWFPCSLYALTIGLPWFRCNVGKVNGVLLLYINMFSCVLSCEIGMRSFRVTAQFPQSEDFAPVPSIVEVYDHA